MASSTLRYIVVDSIFVIRVFYHSDVDIRKFAATVKIEAKRFLAPRSKRFFDVC